MLGNIVLLTVTYIFAAASAPIGNVRDESSARGSPLTDHLMKFLNHFDDSIIGFHLVVPRDDLILNSYVDKPSQVSKILEYVTQINYLRNMIENDPEVSIKKTLRSEKSAITEMPKNNLGNDPHHTDILIFSQVSPKKTESSNESVIMVPYLRDQDISCRNNDTTYLHSRTVGRRPKALFNHKKDLPIFKKFSNYSNLKNFEEGLRIYPLISVSQRNDSIDCFSGKVNCTQNEICFMSRVRRKPTAESNYSGSCSFLIQPCSSVNPTLLFVPKSLDNFRSNNFHESAEKKNNVDHDNEHVSGNPTLHQSMTFLAPIFDSALVLPLKGNSKASNNFGDSAELTKEEYASNNVKKRESTNSNCTTQGRYNNCSRSFEKDDSVASASSADTDRLSVSTPAISLNKTNCDSATFSSDSFADILRQSISDLVNGINHEPSPADSSYDNSQPVSSDSNMNGYNIYFLLEPANEFYYNFSNVESDPQTLYSSPKGKLNKPIMEEQCNSYVNLGNCWSYLLSQRKNKSTQYKSSADFFSSDLDENDALCTLNSFYRHKISQILSFAKKGRCGLENKNSKKSKRTCEEENILIPSLIYKWLIEDGAEGGGEHLENDVSSDRLRKEAFINDTSKLSSETLDMISFLSDFLSKCSSTNDSNLFADKYDFTKKVEEKPDYLTECASSANNTNIFNRIMRSLGRLKMIPTVDKNFDLLIVYPYDRDNIVPLKTLVNKSVKKYNRSPSERRNRPTSSSSKKSISVTKGYNLKAQLDKAFSDDLRKQNYGNPDPNDEFTSNYIQKLVDALKPVSYNERNDIDSDTKLNKRFYDSLPPTMFSFRSPVSNFVESSAQNQSELSGVKLPLNLSDFQAIKLLQSVTAAPSSSKSNDTEGAKELKLLRNLSAAVTLDALKMLQDTPPISESKSTKLISTTEYLGLNDTYEPLNNSSMENPFHSSNGFRVSNATNLLIKLTEFKALNDTNITPNPADDDGVEVTHSGEPAVSNGIILFETSPQPSFFNSYGKLLSTTERSMGPLLKSSLTFISAFVSNNSKMTKNNSNNVESSLIPAATDFVKHPQTYDETDAVSSATENLENQSHYPTVLSFTESGNKEFYTFAFPMLNSLSSTKSGPLRAGNCIAHSTRPWASPVTSTPTYYDDSDESADEGEDAEINSGYPEFAPVISVNIFPVLGGWRKPQIEATSLIKELFRTTKKKVEEEQLPTYLSELFNTEDESKLKPKNLKEFNSAERKLDAILSGKSLINDVMKYKVQNILQLSTKPAKGTLPKDNQISS